MFLALITVTTAEGGDSIMESITTALSGITAAGTSVLSWITDNPLLSICFVGGTVVPVVFKFIKGSKRAAK